MTLFRRARIYFQTVFTLLITILLTTPAPSDANTTNIRFKIIWLNAIEGGDRYSPRSINKHGAVVGTYERQNRQRPFYYYNGIMKDLGPVGTTPQGDLLMGTATSINDDFITVGESQFSGVTDFQNVIYRDNGIYKLDNSPPKDGSPSDLIINNRGDITGKKMFHYPYMSNGTWIDNWDLAAFFMTSAGSFVNLEPSHTPPYTSYTPKAMNASGQIVGNAYNTWLSINAPFVTSGGSTTLLSTIDGFGTATAINDQGHVVGHGLWGPTGFLHANGQRTDLDGWPYGINNSGWIVGEIRGSGGACIWINKIRYNLNDLAIKNGKKFFLIAAKAINNNGWIVGVGENYDAENGLPRYSAPFIAIPVDASRQVGVTANFLLNNAQH